MKFSGLSRLVAKVKGFFSASGRKGGKTEAALETKRVQKQLEREEAPPREKRDSQSFPIPAAARRKAIATTAGYGLPGVPVIGSRLALELRTEQLEKEMRVAWERRVGDGILARAENEIRAAKEAFAREHGISRKAARRILNEMRRAGVHVVKIAAGTELERELVLSRKAA